MGVPGNIRMLTLEPCLPGVVHRELDLELSARLVYGLDWLGVIFLGS